MRIVVILALLLSSSCGTKDEAAPDKPESRPPKLTSAMGSQMREACAAYVAHVCDCAAARPTETALAEQCRLARAIPQALDLSILSAQEDKESVLDQTGLLANVNKIQRSCIEEAARLETRCPRTVAAPEPK